MNFPFQRIFVIFQVKKQKFAVVNDPSSVFWGVDVNLVRISSCASYASDSIDHKDKVGRGADWDGDWGETGVSARGMLRFFKLAKNEIHVF